jgi:hypothetical protein
MAHPGPFGTLHDVTVDTMKNAARILGGTGGCAGASSTTGGNATGGHPATSTVGAVAITGLQLDNCYSQMGGSAVSASSSSGGGDGSTLFLVITSPAAVCSCPLQNPSCGSWEVSIGLTPDLQKPGTIDLSSGVNSTFGELGPQEGPMPGNCPQGGGGSFIGGTLEVVSIDASQVVFTLSGTTPLDFGGNADGTYTAPRCP